MQKILINKGRGKRSCWLWRRVIRSRSNKLTKFWRSWLRLIRMRFLSLRLKVRRYWSRWKFSIMISMLTSDCLIFNTLNSRLFDNKAYRTLPKTTISKDTFPMDPSRSSFYPGGYRTCHLSISRILRLISHSISFSRRILMIWNWDKKVVPNWCYFTRKDVRDVS